LDLLLFLIRKKKVDIHDIPISIITKEYLDYLDRMDTINLEREAEFLLMASLLIHIKSQMLLPREKTIEDEPDDSQKDLIERLLYHQKIKASCTILREREGDQLMQWQRENIPHPLETDEIDIANISLFDLAEAFFTLMKDRSHENIQTLENEEISIEEKMKEILDDLKKNDYLDFFEYFQKQNTLEEALVTFLCLLELIKAKVVIAIQESLFQRIKVWLRKEEIQ
jgi:segregation and condensation protein A